MRKVARSKARRHTGDGLIVIVRRGELWTCTNPFNNRINVLVKGIGGARSAVLHYLGRRGAKLCLEQGDHPWPIVVDPPHRCAVSGQWLPWRVLGNADVAAALDNMQAEYLRDGVFATSYRSQREAYLAALRSAEATGCNAYTADRSRRAEAPATDRPAGANVVAFRRPMGGGRGHA